MNTWALTPAGSGAAVAADAAAGTAARSADTAAALPASLLSCRGVDVRAGARCLVRGLDLDIAAGQRWAVVGPNGAGKSSLLLVLAGARRPDAGAVALGGRTLGHWSVEALAGVRAMVADRWVDPFATSVRDTVQAARFRLRGAPPLPHDAADVAGNCLALLDCAHLAGRDVRQLSRGERQRVAVAAALAQDTALVLLDEPISHQDPRHQVQVLQALQARRTTTYVAALHDINAAARFATHALLLAGDGSWVAGARDSVLTRERLSPLFSTTIAEIDVAGHRVFVSLGDAA